MIWGEGFDETEREQIIDIINAMWEQNRAAVLMSLAPCDFSIDEAHDYLANLSLVFQIRNESNQEGEPALDGHDVELVVEGELLGFFEYDDSLDCYHWRAMDFVGHLPKD